MKTFTGVGKNKKTKKAQAPKKLKPLSDEGSLSDVSAYAAGFPRVFSGLLLQFLNDFSVHDNWPSVDERFNGRMFNVSRSKLNLWSKLRSKLS